MKVGIPGILTHSRPKTKLVLSVVGLFLSLVVISSVFQLFNDINCLLEGNKSEDGFEYLQISKEIGLSTTLGLSSPEFTTYEINQIKSQKCINDVGPLYSNDFRVYGSFAGNSFDMFFTSVEDGFIDADLSKFSWDIQDDIVPVIVSNQFLTIMNHAVLPSQGQRPIPKIVVKQAIVNLDLTKGHKRLQTKARVVGFSDRISSVLVPKSFLDYTNKKLSGKSDSRVSMLILKVIDSGSKELSEFLSENRYEVSGEMPIVDNAKSILEIVIVIILIFGIVILFTSVALNLSQVKLIIIENKDRIKMLVLLGYSPKLISNSLLKSGIFVLGATLLLVFCVIWIIFNNLHNTIEQYKLGNLEFQLLTFLIPVFLIGVFFFILSKSLRNQIK